MDTSAECRVRQKLFGFGVFVEPGNELRNIATKDQATEEIQEALLDVEEIGTQQLTQFVKERLMSFEGEHKTFYHVMKRNKPPTFAKLYEVRKVDTHKESLKIDRSILQRLVICYASGRDVNLNSILMHELLPVPLSLAEIDGSLRSGAKHILMDVLLQRVCCTEKPSVPDSSTLVIDGQALVVALGKTQLSKTFGDFAKTFSNVIYQYGQHFSRIDIVFDRYLELSIKDGTRVRRKRKMPIRRVIENKFVPLPHDWDSFLSDPKNKADLANFLSRELITLAPNEKCVVTGGGLLQVDDVLCNMPHIDLEDIRSTHEEADTRMILHCSHTDSSHIVVWSRDTDVLLLLIAHSFKIDKEIWMKAGTNKAPKYISITNIINAWNLTPELALSLLQFHAFTGSDCTSYFAGHTKKTALSLHLKHPDLLGKLGKEPFTSETVHMCEQFTCLIYKTPEAESANDARIILFKKGVKQELLPPTSDSLKQHVLRAHL